MKQEFEWHIRTHFPNLAKQKVLIANSSGVDSMVLTHLLSQLKIPFSLAYCHFQLRAAADQELLFLQEWAEKASCPFFSQKFQTQTYAKRQKISIQMAARELRYQWFADLVEAESFDVILTAHHLNDQLETYLMHSFRVTGPQGLLGIPSLRERIQRPLLPFTKAQILTFAEEESLLWCEDASNATDAYLRNRIRHHVVPELEKAIPELYKNFQKTIAQNRQQEDFVTAQLDAWKKEHWKSVESGWTIALDALQNHPQQAFVCHRLFSSYGFERKEVQKLLNAQVGRALFSTSYRLQRERDHLWLNHVIAVSDAEFTLNDWSDLKTLPISIEHTTALPEAVGEHQAYLDPCKITFPLVVRHWKKGDFFYPTAMTGKKKISKYFKDEKYSQADKEGQWLLCEEAEVLWVIGKRCHRKYTASLKNKDGILLTFRA